jgi:N,N'-diacetyllegionaminate synthase
MPEPVRIGSFTIAPGHPCFVIAEAGVNHNGNLDLARRLIDEAARAGANAVKFQMFKADKLVSRSAPKAAYQVRTTGGEESQHEMIRRLELGFEQHRLLLDHAEKQGLMLLSTPFDEESADELEALGIQAFKIPSGEVINLPFLAHLARKKTPIILSTGMSDLAEVAAAVRTIEENGNPPLILLQCLTNYPADPAEINLRAMSTMAAAFGVPVGYSDHVVGNEVAFAAVALGACLVEKHFTLDRTLPGPDHQASLEPDELAALIQGIRSVEAALGDGIKRPAPSEKDISRIVRKSLVTTREIPAGTEIESSMLIAKRPGTGISPADLSRVLGRRTRRDVPGETVLTSEDLL